MRRAMTIACGLLLLLTAAPAWGQGVLIVTNSADRVWLPRPIRHPRPAPPPVSYKIKELGVQARINDQVARVHVSQSFVNTGSRQMEVCFVFPLPYDGAVDQLTFLVDGKEYPAKLLPAKEARSIYEGYIRRNRDPALLEWLGTGMFKTSVFPVPPGAERKVTMQYSQLLRKDHALTDFVFPLSTAKYTSHAVEKVSIRATIESSLKIKSVYSPTHSVDVKRSDNKHAVVTYQAQNNIPSADFRLFYDTAKTDLGASVISYRPEGEDGYFMLLASPAIKDKSKERPKKTVVFVVDRSGSMSGKKIEQAKEALRFVLNNLRAGDLFNIVAYDASVESFRPELQKYDEESRKAALGFVEGLYAGGSTNIDGALSSALSMIQDPDRPNYVLFLTDGRPTAGETKEVKIVQNVKGNNSHRARIISLGVGYDVNSRLLDRLTYANHGKTEFVRPDEDLEDHVSRLYSRISSPVMTDVKVTIDIEGTKVETGPSVNRVYPREVPDLFEGEQLVLVGRYKKSGTAKVVVQGKVGKGKLKFDFPAKFTKRSRDDSYSFVEKLWAMRRIGQIIDEIDLHGENSELVQELVNLSTKHGILTPYTSFLADDQAPAEELANIRLNVGRARQSLQQLELSAGRRALSQRSAKGFLKDANQVPRAYYAGGAPAQTAPADPASQAGAAPAGAAGLGGASRAGNRGGVAGGGGFGNAPAGAPALGQALVLDVETDAVKAVSGFRHVGKDSLYVRGKLLIASNARDVDLEKEKAKIKEIERFSEDYFKLTAANTPAENALLAAQQEGEELIILLRKQVYRIK